MDLWASIITVMYGITRCLRGRRLPIFLTVDRGGSDNCDVESIPTHELCFA